MSTIPASLIATDANKAFFHIETDPATLRYRQQQGHSLVIEEILRQVGERQGAMLDELIWPLLSSARAVVSLHVRELASDLGVDMGGAATPTDRWARVAPALRRRREEDAASLDPLVSDLLSLCSAVLDCPADTASQAYLEVDGVTALVLKTCRALDGTVTGLSEQMRSDAEMHDELAQMYS